MRINSFQMSRTLFRLFFLKLFRLLKPGALTFVLIAGLLFATHINAENKQPPENLLKEQKTDGELWSLEKLISLAQENNQEIKVQKAVLNTAWQTRRRAEWARYIPHLEMRSINGLVPEAKNCPLDGSATANSQCRQSPAELGSTFDNLGFFTRWEVDLVQPLYTFGKLEGALKAAQSNIKIRRQQVKQKKQTIAIRISKLYWSILFARDSLEVISEVEEKLEEAEEKVKEKLEEETGEVTQADLFKVKVYKGDVAAKRLEAEKGMKTAIEVILNTAGLTQEEQYKIFLGDLEELALESKPLSFYLKKMVTSRPELEILKQGLKAKHAQVAVVKSDYFPQIFIGGMLRFAYAPNREEPNNAYISDYFNTFSLGAGVGLKQKLGFHTTYAKLEESRAQLMELQRQNSLLNHVLPLEVKKNYYALQETQQRLEASYSSYKAGKSWFRSVGMNYGVGICDIDEMLEAYGAYIKTKTMYYKAILDFNLAVIELNASAGIFDFSPTTVGD